MATLRWHGFPIRLRLYQLNGESLRKLGLNPNYWPRGVEIGLAMPRYFKSIMQIMGIGEGRLGGIYHPQLKKVLAPEDISQLELCHEVLHGLLDGRQDGAFSRLVLDLVRAAKGSGFFSKVAERTNGGYNLTTIHRLSNHDLLADKATRLFVTEVFAFAGTKVIFERMGKGEVERDLGEVPQKLKDYFERFVVDPRLPRHHTVRGLLAEAA